MICIVLAGCRSAPIRYHTLLPAFSEQTDAVPVNVAVQSVSVPAQVDRAQIVVRRGDNELSILESDWWGATLAEELKNALADRLAPRSVQGASALPKPLTVRVDVRRFDTVPGQYALIDAQWRLFGAGRPSLACGGVFRTEAADSVDAVVVAQQNNIAQLAAQIAAGARRWDGMGGCP